MTIFISHLLDEYTIIFNSESTHQRRQYIFTSRSKEKYKVEVIGGGKRAKKEAKILAARRRSSDIPRRSGICAFKYAVSNWTTWPYAEGND